MARDGRLCIIVAGLVVVETKVNTPLENTKAHSLSVPLRARIQKKEHSERKRDHPQKALI